MKTTQLFRPTYFSVQDWHYLPHLEQRENLKLDAEDAANDARSRNEANEAFVMRTDELNQIDLYARLELNNRATIDEIRAAHQRLNRANHPNRLQRNLQNQLNNGDITQQQFDDQLAGVMRAAADRNEAHEILTNPVQRQLYDIMRANPERIRAAIRQAQAAQQRRW